MVLQIPLNNHFQRPHSNILVILPDDRFIHIPISSFHHELCYFNPNSRYFPRFDGNLYQCVRFLAAKITFLYLSCHAGAAGAGVMAYHGAKSQGLPCTPRKSPPSARRLRRLPPLQRHTVGQPRRGGRGRRRAAWSPQQKVVAVERRCLFQLNDHVKLLLVKICQDYVCFYDRV